MGVTKKRGAIVVIGGGAIVICTGMGMARGGGGTIPHDNKIFANVESLDPNASLEDDGFLVEI